jgi:hypothetical protein
LSTITVGDRDIDGLRIPALVSFSGRILMEDSSGPLFPQIPVTLTATRSDGGTTQLPIPRGSLTVFASGGSGFPFGLRLPEGEYRITLHNLPPSLVLKSMTYGFVDLMKDPLILDPPSPQQIRILFGKN